MFIKIENGQPIGHPVTVENMRYLFPNFNFNQIITTHLANQIGFAIYEFTNPPPPNGIYKKLAEGTPSLNTDNGIYYQNWQIVDMNDIEKLEWDRSVAKSVRNERNRMLTASDWTQIPDAPITEAKREEYRVYRQELRDLSARSDFPHGVVRHATIEEFKRELVYPVTALTEQARAEFEQLEYISYLAKPANVLDVSYPT